jgi:hypothetical protein
MKRIIKEPLLHFLLLGAAIFAAYQWKPNRSVTEDGKIVVTQAQIEHLATGFTMIWQRRPTTQELDGLIRDYVREEVYCREAKAMGMDKDDTVIRRRLSQKMEFVMNDMSVTAEPTDADLEAYLKAHADQFKQEPRFTFRQVYLNPQQHGENLARDAAQLLEKLNLPNGTADATTAGDPILLEADFNDATASKVASQLGEKFAARLPSLTTGKWQGPVESSYGVHLVLVTERKESRLPELSEVRDAVRREWETARRSEANEKVYADLLKHYDVSIEQPINPDSKKLAALKQK